MSPSRRACWRTEAHTSAQSRLRAKAEQEEENVELLKLGC